MSNTTGVIARCYGLQAAAGTQLPADTTLHHEVCALDYAAESLLVAELHIHASMVDSKPTGCNKSVLMCSHRPTLIQLGDSCSCCSCA